MSSWYYRQLPTEKLSKDDLMMIQDEELGSIDDLPIEFYDLNMAGLQESVFISGGVDRWSETSTGW